MPRSDRFSSSRGSARSRMRRRMRDRDSWYWSRISYPPSWAWWLLGHHVSGSFRFSRSICRDLGAELVPFPVPLDALEDLRGGDVVEGNAAEDGAGAAAQQEAVFVKDEARLEEEL